jgi:hypothetical protein
VRKLDIGIILLSSISLRVIAALLLGNHVVALPGTADQVSYHHLALRVIDGYGFSFEKAWWPMTAAGAPTAHWSYLYTLYLAAVYTLAGPSPLVARLIQAVLVGLLQPYLAFCLASQVLPKGAGRTVPVLAAGLTAVYPYFVYYAATLMTEPFFVTAVLASLVVTIGLSRQRDGTAVSKQALVLGLVLSTAVLLRQLFLLFIPVLWIWLWLSTRRVPARPVAGRSILLSGALLSLVLLSTTAFNYSRFNRLLLLNTNAGFAFYWANHPVYGDRFVAASEMADSYGDLVPVELRHLDEASLDQALLRRGIAFVLDDPARYVRLSLSRIPHYFKFWPDPASSLISNVVRVGSFGVLLPFMLYGLVQSIAGAGRAKGADRFSAPNAALLLIYLFIGTYTLIHLLSWAQIRYRLPVDASLLIFAAIAVADLARLVERGVRIVSARWQVANP